jgi:hypothetical protein
MGSSVQDVLLSRLSELPPVMRDKSLADRGNIQLNLPALVKQHLSTASSKGDTSPQDDTDPGISQDQQNLVKPSHADVLRAAQLLSEQIRDQAVCITALDMSGWDLRLKGWQQLLKGVRNMLLCKVVLQNCCISGNPGGWLRKQQQQQQGARANTVTQHNHHRVCYKCYLSPTCNTQYWICSC